MRKAAGKAVAEAAAGKTGAAAASKTRAGRKLPRTAGGRPPRRHGPPTRGPTVYRDSCGEAIHPGDFVTWAGGAGFVEEAGPGGVSVSWRGGTAAFGGAGPPASLLTVDARDYLD